MAEQFPETEYAETAAEVLDDADRVAVVTDWEEFSELDEEFDSMSTPVVMDGRRCIEHREGIT
jgi:UDPglucose 6-dehydrogenase